MVPRVAGDLRRSLAGDFDQGPRFSGTLSASARQHTKHSRTARLTPLHAVETRDRRSLARGSRVVAPESNPLTRSPELLLS